MLKKRITALLAAIALILGLCGTGALAAEAENSEPLVESVEAVEPDPEGTVSFGNLAGRMRENSLNYLILEQSVAQIEVIDYEKMEEDLIEGINQIAAGQWMMIELARYYGVGEGSNSYAFAQAQQAAATLRETFEALKDGSMQEDNDALLRQLRNAQDQVLMAGESLYIALAGLEITDSSLLRSLDALDRTVAEMELRYGMGQISALTLQTTKNGRTALASSRETLALNIRNLRLQLELMIGAETDGSIQLQALPQVTDEQLAAMDPEADLAAAKEISYQLFAAQRTLDDAKETYEDNRSGSYRGKQAEYAWQAAQYTYQNTVRAFELTFQQLYTQVGDYKQALDAARTALALKEAEYAVAQLKYDMGRLSKNALLSARDDVTAAQETVDNALIDLFSAYNTYRWAVDYGILN